MVFRWFSGKTTIGNDGFRWLCTIGPTMEWLCTIVEVYILRCLTDFCWDWLIKLLPQVLKKAPPCVSVEVQNMPWPGFEPGLLRPQRRVLTTRRSRQLVSTRRHMAYEGQKSAPPWKSRKRCATLTRLATDCKEFSWCSGYHICLTHRRSPVRSRAKTYYSHVV